MLTGKSSFWKNDLLFQEAKKGGNETASKESYPRDSMYVFTYIFLFFNGKCR